MKDNEWAGVGNHYDYGARHYDPRIARWFGVDPLFGKYPGTSSYAYALNTPIFAYDPDGKVVVFADRGAASLFKDIYSTANKETQAKLDVLQSSDVVYYLETSSQSSGGRQGATEYNFKSKRVEIKIQANYKSKNPVGTLADELETAYQFENGDIGYIQNNDNTVASLGYDMQDEVATKRAEVAATDAVSVAKGKTIKMDETTVAFKKADTDPVPEGKTRNQLLENYFNTDPSARQYLGLFDSRGSNMNTQISGSGDYSQRQLDAAVSQRKFKSYIYREKVDGKNTTVQGGQ